MSWRHLVRFWVAGIPTAMAVLAGYLAGVADGLAYVYVALCLAMAAASLHYVFFESRRES